MLIETGRWFNMWKSLLSSTARCSLQGSKEAFLVTIKAPPSLKLRPVHANILDTGSKFVINSRSFSSCIPKDDIKLEHVDEKAVEQLKEALVESDRKVEEEIIDDYKFLLHSVREKMRLTVEWNETTKMTQRETIKHTAARVGFLVDYDDDKQKTS